MFYITFNTTELLAIMRFIINAFASEHLLFKGKINVTRFRLENLLNLAYEFLCDNFNKKICSVAKVLTNNKILYIHFLFSYRESKSKNQLTKTLVSTPTKKLTNSNKVAEKVSFSKLTFSSWL